MAVAATAYRIIGSNVDCHFLLPLPQLLLPRTHSADAGKTLVSDLNGAQLCSRGSRGSISWAEEDTPLPQWLLPQRKVLRAQCCHGVVSETFDVIIELCPTGAAASHISLNFLMKLFLREIWERERKTRREWDSRHCSHYLREQLMETTQKKKTQNKQSHTHTHSDTISIPLLVQQQPQMSSG